MERLRVSKLITVSSISGGGKTAVTKVLSLRIENSITKHFDELDHLVDFPKNYPHSDISEFNLRELQNYFQDLDDLTDIIIFDYPFGKVHKAFKSRIDLAIFIDTSEVVALERRVDRDNLDLENERKNYSSVKSAYLKFIETVKPSCDLIVDGKQTLDEIADQIINSKAFSSRITSK